MNDKLTSAEALAAMLYFLENYWERGHSEEIAILLSSLLIQPDGKCADPAFSEDWEECVSQVIRERPAQSF